MMANHASPWSPQTKSQCVLPLSYADPLYSDLLRNFACRIKKKDLEDVQQNVGPIQKHFLYPHEGVKRALI